MLEILGQLLWIVGLAGFVVSHVFIFRPCFKAGPHWGIASIALPPVLLFFMAKDMRAFLWPMFALLAASLSVIAGVLIVLLSSGESLLEIQNRLWFGGVFPTIDLRPYLRTLPH